MDGYLKPATEGLVSSDTVLDANGFLRKHELKVGQAKSLSQLNEDFAFFTPAVLYLYGRFRDSPLADFVYLQAPECKFYYRKFNNPVFHGLEARSNGNPDWNFVLWAIERRFWEDFTGWMVGITFTYEDEKAVARIGEQSFEILDPLGRDRNVIRHGGLPTLRIGAFGLDGSKFKAGFVQGPSKLMDLPKVTFFAPGEDMKVFTGALYGGDNPLDAVAWHRWQKLKETQP